MSEKWLNPHLPSAEKKVEVMVGGFLVMQVPFKPGTRRGTASVCAHACVKRSRAQSVGVILGHFVQEWGDVCVSTHVHVHTHTHARQERKTLHA